MLTYAGTWGPSRLSRNADTRAKTCWADSPKGSTWRRTPKELRTLISHTCLLMACICFASKVRHSAALAIDSKLVHAAVQHCTAHRLVPHLPEQEPLQSAENHSVSRENLSFSRENHKHSRRRHGMDADMMHDSGSRPTCQMSDALPALNLHSGLGCGTDRQAT